MHYVNPDLYLHILSGTRWRGGGRKEVGEGGEQGGGTSSTLGWVGFYRKLKVSGVFCLINILFE